MAKRTYPGPNGTLVDRVSVDLNPEQLQALKEVQAQIVARQPGLSACTQAHALRFCIDFVHQTLCRVNPRKGA